MKYLVISDTHGRLDRMSRLAAEAKYDGVMHLGDSCCSNEDIQSLFGAPLYIVRGNCDMFSENEASSLLSVAGHKIFLTHGHHYGVKSDLLDLAWGAKKLGAEYAFFGHTHEAVIEEEEEVILANPGSLTYPHGSAPSYIVMETDEEGNINLSIKYLYDR